MSGYELDRLPTSREDLAKRIDHTLLKAFATRVDITELCDEAVAHGFGVVCVNPAWVSFCAKRLEGASVGVNATVGFPLGANTPVIKLEETREAVQNGAGEIDMVLNIGALKSGLNEYVGKEIEAVVKAAGDAHVKVILETSYLSQEEKVLACRLAVAAGAAFVKTSTGFGSAGATTSDVELMRATVGDRAGVKAAGGIRTYRDVRVMFEAGADRIGTSSGIEILQQFAS